MKESMKTPVNLGITTAILGIITTLCLTSDISLTDKLFTSVPFGLLTAGFGYAAVKSIKDSLISKTR
ncbi:MAG: hypothetical protein J6S57_03090 [Alphaproteobacteria bacterium]|nr:hypothetical protein [Alphaproteobacteria bacterium]